MTRQFSILPRSLFSLNDGCAASQRDLYSKFATPKKAGRGPVVGICQVLLFYKQKRALHFTALLWHFYLT